MDRVTTIAHALAIAERALLEEGVPLGPRSSEWVIQVAIMPDVQRAITKTSTRTAFLLAVDRATRESTDPVQVAEVRDLAARIRAESCGTPVIIRFGGGDYELLFLVYEEAVNAPGGVS